MTLPAVPVSAAWASTRSRILRDRGVDEAARCPCLGDARDADHEVAQHLPAGRGVDDLRMELDAVEVAGWVSEPGVRRGIGLRGRVEALGQAGDGVAVAHPDGLLPLDVREQTVVRGDGHRRRTVLPTTGRQHVTTQAERHELGAVADAEHRDAAAPDGTVRVGSSDVIHRVGAAREDDGAHTAPLQLRHRRVEGQQLGIDMELAHAPRDELCELAAEVEDGDGLGRLVDRGGGTVRWRPLR